jgi:hypothetical protein
MVYFIYGRREFRLRGRKGVTPAYRLIVGAKALLLLSDSEKRDNPWLQSAYRRLQENIAA